MPECLHARTREAVVRNPMETWRDLICRDCGRTVRWPERLLARRAELLAELSQIEAEMTARGIDGGDPNLSFVRGATSPLVRSRARQ